MGSGVHSGGFPRLATQVSSILPLSQAQGSEEGAVPPLSSPLHTWGYAPCCGGGSGDSLSVSVLVPRTSIRGSLPPSTPPPCTELLRGVRSSPLFVRSLSKGAPPPLVLRTIHPPTPPPHSSTSPGGLRPPPPAGLWGLPIFAVSLRSTSFVGFGTASPFYASLLVNPGRGLRPLAGATPPSRSTGKCSIFRRAVK